MSSPSAPSVPAAGLRRRLRGPAAAVLRPLLRASGGKVGVALVYHGVRPREPEAIQVVPSIGRERIRDHLRHLSRHYTVVPLPELITAAARRRRGERYPVALSFDDDLGEHLDHAAPLLAAEQVPATFFLCGRDLLGDGEFWWETLQRAAESGVSTADLGSLAGMGNNSATTKPGLREIAAEIETLSEQDRGAVVAQLTALVGEGTPERRLGDEQISNLTRSGHTVGFHTRRHQVLTTLDSDALASALSDGRDQLSGASGMPIEMIAYPHGKADMRVANAAREAGFRFGLETGASVIGPGSDPLRLRRLAADELTVDELGAAIAAVLFGAHSRG